MKKRHGVICAGNWIVDLVHEITNWPNENDLERITRQTMGIGGGAANVSFVLSKIDGDLPIWPMGAIGDDQYGKFVLAECTRLGFPQDLMHQKIAVPTAHTHVMSVIGKSRTFFYQGGANDELTVKDFPEGTFRNSSAKLFYFGYIMLLRELDKVRQDGTTGAAEVLKRARDAGLTTCVDLVSAQRPDFATSVGAALPFIDYLILNEVEAARATDFPENGERSISDEAVLKEMAAMLIEGGVRKAVIIHCPEHAIWYARDGQHQVLKSRTLDASEIVSPLGAGDAFCAGTLYALHQNWEPADTLRLGHAAARASLGGTTASEAVPRLEGLL